MSVSVHTHVRKDSKAHGLRGHRGCGAAAALAGGGPAQEFSMRCCSLAPRWRRSPTGMGCARPWRRQIRCVTRALCFDTRMLRQANGFVAAFRAACEAMANKVS